MRVSTGMIFDAGVVSLNRQSAKMLHLQQQVATGRRILTPSDDPVNAARALEVTQSRDVVAQFKDNHNNANSALGLAEAHLASTNELLVRIRELAVQGGNSSLTGDDRRSVAFELRARFDELLGIANATDGSGNYIFSGYMGSTKPFGGTVDDTLAGNEIVYQGDDGQRRLQVSPTRFMEISDSGNDVFKRIRNGNGYFSTDYAKTNSGTAVIDGGSILDTTKWNALANRKFDIAFSIDDTALPPVTYYDILDVDPNSPTVGNSLLTGAPPVLPPTAQSGQRVYESGQPITFKSQGAEPPFDLGGSVLITGDPAAGDSFSIRPSTSQSVFSTIGKLIGAVEGATTGNERSMTSLANDVGFSLTNLDQATDNILRIRAQIGSRLGEVESLSNVNEDLGLQYQQTLSQLQDLDYAKAITDLTRSQTDLDAAQKSFSMISRLSLFDKI